MSLIPSVFNSSDPGAPQLTGQVNALVNLLRAILVTGYGSGPTHKPALGWTETYTGVNKAVFRNNPISGSGKYLRVLDDGSAAAGGSPRSASVRAYSEMTDIDTGIDPTPTVEQSTTGPQWVKSRTADGVSRGWWAIGNELCFYLFASFYNAGVSDGPVYFAGDIVSNKPGDQYQFGVSQVSTTNYDGSQLFLSRMLANLVPNSSLPSVSNCAAFLMRSYGASPGAVVVGNLRTIADNQFVYGGSNAYPYPDPVSGGLLYDTALIFEGAPGRLRGRFPGVYVPLHHRPFADLTEISDPDGLPIGTRCVAKNFLGDNQISSAWSGQVLFDLVNPWH